jgi:uncharacterized membrane protein
VITEGFDFIAAIVGLCGVLVWLEQRVAGSLFKWLPSIILVMFCSMGLYTAGAWEMTESVRFAREELRDNLIPAMLFLMSLRFNIVVIRKIGARLIVLCLASTTTIMLAFVLVHRLMANVLGDETPLTFATMAAGWTGGTQNFVAVKEALSVSDAAMSYTLLMGALCYTIWLIMIITLKPFGRYFDEWLKSDSGQLDVILRRVDTPAGRQSIDWQALFLMLGLSLLVSAMSSHLGQVIAASGLLNAMVWSIVFATLAGMLLAPTRFGAAVGSDEVSTIMLYIVVALIGAEVNLGAITKAPMYILSGFMILGIHGALLLVVARLLRVNLTLTAIASIANIGSAPSAAVVAATYDKRLVPIAVSMALIGSMLGSFVGLLVAELLTSQDITSAVIDRCM